MADFVKLRSKIAQIEAECFRRNCLAEDSRQKENRAALQIQSWFKGCQVRAYLGLLHKKATIIQKIWRGFTARACFRQMVKEAYFIMKMNFYEEMAVRIQRRWRGFYVRKYVHNYYARKRFLNGLAMKNAFVRKGLDELEDLRKRQREHLELQKEQVANIHRAHQLHYLLSTNTSPGVFNSPFRSSPHQMELLLRQAKPQPSIRLPPRDSPVSSLPGASRPPGVKSTKSGCSSWLCLPPITSQKPQGPFKEPKEVWEQRLRSPEPSLRLQMPYTRLEDAHEELQRGEATVSLSDTPFLPFSKAHQRSRKYERLLHCTSSIHSLDYGTKHFREDTDRLKEKEPFRTVFTPCDVTENFGRLPSKAGNTV